MQSIWVMFADISKARWEKSIYSELLNTKLFHSFDLSSVIPEVFYNN